jgi:hypothetical protein
MKDMFDSSHFDKGVQGRHKLVPLVLAVLSSLSFLCFVFDFELAASAGSNIHEDVPGKLK